MERISSATDLLRPDVTLGGTVEGLSFPQQEDSKDVHAWQKHHDTAVVIQTITDAQKELRSEEFDDSEITISNTLLPFLGNYRINVYERSRQWRRATIWKQEARVNFTSTVDKNLLLKRETRQGFILVTQ